MKNTKITISFGVIGAPVAPDDGNTSKKVTEMNEKMIELREKFLSLQSNSDVETMQRMQEELEKYLRDNEGTEFKTLDNTIRLLKGLINYTETNNIHSSYELIFPMLNDLEFGANMERIKCNYNRKLLIFSISICKDYKQSIELINALDKNFDLYPKDEVIEDDFKTFMYINMTERLLYAKAFENLSNEKIEEVTMLFKKYIRKAKGLCAETNRLNWQIILLSRENMFFGNMEGVSEALHISHGIRESSIYRLRLYKELEQFASSTLFSQEYEENVTRKVGERFRLERSENGLTITDISKISGLSIGLIEAIENGKNGISIGKLARLAKVLGLELKYFAK